MLLSFACLAFSAVLRLLIGSRRSATSVANSELLVLRHQLVVLGRQAAHDRYGRRIVRSSPRLLAFTRRGAAHGLIVTPQNSSASASRSRAAEVGAATTEARSAGDRSPVVASQRQVCASPWCGEKLLILLEPTRVEAGGRKLTGDQDDDQGGTPTN
jgi:hypothetical protein